MTRPPCGRLVPVQVIGTRRLVGSLVLAALTYSLLQTVVVPALPAIQRDFGSSPSATAWVLTGFLLQSAVATALLARLGDRYGHRRAILASLVVYGVGCVGAALAPSLGWLIASRIVQGTSGALVPLSFAALGDAVAPNRVGGAVGVVSGTFAAGAVLGFTAGTLVLELWSWRTVFWITLVLIVVAYHGVATALPRGERRRHTTSLDVRGAALLAIGLTLLLFAITQTSTWGWWSPGVVALAASGVSVLFMCGRIERSVTEPMLDVRLLLRPSVLATSCCAFAAGWATYAAPALTVLIVQVPRSLDQGVQSFVDYGLDASPAVAGLCLLPASLVYLVVGPLVGRHASVRRTDGLLAAGLALMVAGLAALAAWHDSPLPVIAGVTIAMAGVATVMAVMPLVLVSTVPPSHRGMALGANNVIRTAGTAMSAQVSAAILAGVTLPDLAVPRAAAYSVAWTSAAGICLAGAVATLTVRRRPEAQIARS